MKSDHTIFLTALLMLLSLPSFGAPGKDDFTGTLKHHLDAIQARDFKAFCETITDQPQISFLLEEGAYCDKTHEYKDSIKGWFEAKGWKLNYTVVRQVESAEMAFALLRIHIDDTDKNGKATQSNNYLLLIFQKQNGEWRLIHDQNTSLKSKES
jgi:ketosteroid isomerase-like protein